MTHRIRLALALLLLTGAMRAGAQPAPYHRWRTLTTAHFNVHVPAGLEREGRIAGAAAERAYAQLSKELTPPRGMIELVVSDDADYSNGNATPFPSNRIVVFATPPVESGALRLTEDWLGLVITHELTHIFHLDRVRGPWAAAQKIFGRVPDLFPAAYQPSWLLEGLAVYYESRLTDGGRLKSAEHHVLARTAARERILPHLADLSLAYPRFPRGGVTYTYGSLLMEYLTSSGNDSAMRKFIDMQSGRWNPLALSVASRTAFGVSFADGFERWRDSLQRSVSPSAPPLPNWRDLSTQGYSASAPRWVNDTTLVYTASDGRESNAAYTITTSGARRRLSRRNSEGPSVPLPGGGLLYSQLDYVGTSEVRSDLYVERDGNVTQLTHGARLIQPDVRQRDGRIVAVKIDAGRSSLVLLDPDGKQLEVLRDAAPGEMWTEPRWSPNGQIIAASRALRGIFSIDLTIPGMPGNGSVLREKFLLSSPEWSATGDTLFYVSERSGTPRVEAWASRTALYTPAGDSTFISISDLARSPRGAQLAGIALHADGLHVGAAPMPSLTPLPGVESTASFDGKYGPPAAQPQASGEFTEYSPWSTLRPRYWLPVAESIADDKLALGASTNGYDILRRHYYSVWGALSTSGRFFTGSAAYRYAGLRRPLIDVSVWQDWTTLGTVFFAPPGAPTVMGAILKRTQDLSLSATVYRPRVRTSSSLTAGVGVERRAFASDPSGVIELLGPSYAATYTYPRAFVAGSWLNYQRPLLSISPEDGVALAFTARERLRTDDASGTASASIVGTAAAYRSLDTRGYAHSVLALRLAAGVADAKAPSSFEVGGSSGTTLSLIPGYTVGEGRRTFGVRGFPTASIYGTKAVAGSVEYRVPHLLGGRGWSRFPLFFDRSSVSLFGDAGAADCASVPLYVDVCSPPGIIGHTIASVGAEYVFSSAVVIVDAPILFRLGIAAPVAGRELVNRNVSPVSGYLEFGFAY